jgi:hypothetical protein
MSVDDLVRTISTSVEAIAKSGRWQLCLVILSYFLIVYYTNRVLITSPLRLQLMERIAEERAELRSLNATQASAVNQTGNGSSSAKPAHEPSHFDTDQCNTAATEVVEGICELLNGAERRVTFRFRLPLRERRNRTKHIHPFITLAKVRAGWRYVHAAERLRMKQCKDDELRAFAVIASERLIRLQAEEATFLSNTIRERLKPRALSDKLTTSPATTEPEASLALQMESTSEAGQDAEGVRATVEVQDRGQRDRAVGELQSLARDAELSALLGEGLRISYDHADLELETAAEAQRRAMWLTTVGLVLALILGLYGRREPLLLGAVGGFLAPLTLVWQREDQGKVNEYATSWGLLLLGPVAGALAAYGGLLLLRFLSDEKINVLGEVFRNNSWEDSTTPLALAFALLFGFSGRLFGRLALTATTQALPPTPGGGPAGATATPGPTGATATPGPGASEQKAPKTSPDGTKDSGRSAPTSG